MPAADGAVHPVGRHDQIGVAEPEGRKAGVVAHLDAETQLDPKSGGSALEDLEQLDAGEPSESMAAGGDRPALEVDVDIVPAGEAGGDLPKRLGVGGLEVAEGLVGEDDAPAE